MTVSCCSDERQVINAGGAHLKYSALSALASSLSGMWSPRMEVGATTLAGMRCNLCSWLTFVQRVLMPFVILLQLKKGGVAKAKGEGEKEKECTTECKSRRRRDEKAPWALNYESGEGGGDAKGRRRGGEKHAMYVRCVCGPWRQGCRRC